MYIPRHIAISDPSDWRCIVSASKHACIIEYNNYYKEHVVLLILEKGMRKEGHKTEHNDGLNKERSLRVPPLLPDIDHCHPKASARAGPGLCRGR